MTVDFFLDTEFIEDGRTIDLLSIAIVNSHDDDELYLFNADAKLHLASDWVKQNVFPHMPLCINCSSGVPHWSKDDLRVVGRNTILHDVQKYLLTYGVWPNIQLWADYAAYDHVALAQIFGKMIDLPNGVPMYTNEFQTFQLAVQELTGNIALYYADQRGRPHDALDDAKWLRYKYTKIKKEALDNTLRRSL